MPCDPEDILLYIEGELGPDEAARVRTHTAVCAACRDLLLTEQELESALGGLRDLEPPPDFAAATVRRATCDVASCVMSPAERRRAAAISVALATVSLALLWPTGVYGSVIQAFAPARCMAKLAMSWLQSTGLGAFVVARTLSRGLIEGASLPLVGVVGFLVLLLAVLVWLIAGYRETADPDGSDAVR